MCWWYLCNGNATRNPKKYNACNSVLAQSSDPDLCSDWFAVGTP